MKKLYFFSRSKLQFVEIKNFKFKFIATFLIASGALTAIVFFLYQLFVLNPINNYESLRSENSLLRNKLQNFVSNYALLDKNLDSLIKVNNELRIAANLPVISKEELLLGTGGGRFDQSFDFISNGDIDITKAIEFIEIVNKKVDFEKNQFSEISARLKTNEKLFKSLPALKPCEGSLSDHGFGMRRHPILNIVRMHDGIDIIADVGTHVFAPGAGKIEYAGYNGGYGLMIEVDHGFGYRTVYAHLSSIKVKEGQNIKRGDFIARTGNTGLSSGPHLHYEVHHNGIKQNPEYFFFDDLNFFEFKNQISHTGVR